ncbi:MAG: hypothetical protein HZC55_22680 [Verrucomicrobia bacterium]|nr:hypothetical protein [Verrucomicrobiota bacterium]
MKPLRLFPSSGHRWTGLWLLSVGLVASSPAAEDLWELGRRTRDVHEFNTLFTAQNVRDHLATEAGIAQAINWCRATAVTKVFLETYRGHFQVDRTVIAQARDRFRAAGLDVSGCITTTRVGKASTGWKDQISCFTDEATQRNLKAAFEFCAGLFDEIMIDDFWFTDCTCAECAAARQARKVTIGGREFPVAGDTWDDYRGELMGQLSRQYVIAAARAVNPRVKLIIKYPQWYDRFHERGYDVRRQTDDFDLIWVGTETRDFGDARWGGWPPTAASFIMRWLGGIGGAKCGGGWYDWLGTTEHTYLEQARQTILGGARASTLFAFGGLQRDTGPRNLEVLRQHIPELQQVAAEVRRRTIAGVAAYKPIASSAEKEAYVGNFLGMLGVPVVPCHEFPADAPAAFFTLTALKDPQFAARLRVFISTGRPVLLTDGLRERLAGQVPVDAPNIGVLPVRGNPKALMALTDAEAAAIRGPLLRPLGVKFTAPHRVGLVWFTDGSWVVENFKDEPVTVEIAGETRTLLARSWAYRWR